MNVILLEIRCKECGTRLTEYEVTEKKGHCMECAKEQTSEATPSIPFSLKNWKQSKVANG